MRGRRGSSCCLIKFDGERRQKRFTVVFSLPQPSDIVWRRDVDSVDEGVQALWRELQAMDLVPGGQHGHPPGLADLGGAAQCA